jgi:hypothetical protein
MGKYLWMRSGVAQGEDRAAEVTRRIVRLFVLLGAVIAAYLVLSFFDHAARADSGSLGLPSGQVGATDPAGTVKAAAVGAGKALREHKSTASKAHLPRIHRSPTKTPTVHAPKAQAAKKVHTAKKVQAPRKLQVQNVRVGKTVRQAPVRTPKSRRLPSGAVRHAARATVTSARTAVARHELSKPIPLASLPKPDLPRAELPTSPRLPDWPQLPGPQQAPLPDWPQLPGPQQAQLPHWPQLPGRQQTQLAAGPQVHGAMQNRTPVLTRTTTLPSAAASHQTASAPVCPLSRASAPGLSDVAMTPTVPLPAPPRQPADQSTSTGQARDAGGSNGPAICTVSSSWRPEVVATGRRLAVEFVARGRTVRYAGPPS